MNECDDILKNEIVKKLSQELFLEIKTDCIKLSRYSLVLTKELKSNEENLYKTTYNICNVLEKHKKKHSETNNFYIISTSLSDYIFFPFQNLIKSTFKSTLKHNILKVLLFLTNYSWKFEIKKKNLENLYSFSLYLICGTETNLKNIINDFNFEIKDTIISFFSILLDNTPNDFFLNNEKYNLFFLNKIISLFLEIMLSCNQNSFQENINIVNPLIKTLLKIFEHKMTPDQISVIIPGTFSSIAKYFSESNNLHFTIVINIIDLIKTLLIKVYNDIDLGCEIIKDVITLEGLALINNNNESNKDKQEDNEYKIKYIINNKTTKRNINWVFDSTKKIKLFFLVFFKKLLFSQNFQTKIKDKTKIYFSILKLIEEVFKNSYILLFDSFVHLSLDVCSFLYSFTSSNINEEEREIKIKKLIDIFYSKEYELIDLKKRYYCFYKIITEKLDFFYKNVLSNIFYSANEESIILFIDSLFFYFLHLERLTKILMENKDDIQILKLKFFQKIHYVLVRVLLMENQKKKNSKTLSYSKFNENLNKNFQEIELPPFINSKQIMKTNSHETEHCYNVKSFFSNLFLLSNQNFDDLNGLKIHFDDRIEYFKNSYSITVEKKIISLLKFLYALAVLENDIKNHFDIFDFFNEIESHRLDLENIFSSFVSMWMINSFLTSLDKFKNSFLNSFINLSLNDNSGLMENEDDFNELIYYIIEKSEYLIEKSSDFLNESIILNNTTSSKLSGFELVYSISLKTLGLLSTFLSIKDFQTQILIKSLYYFFEALSFKSLPLIQSLAIASIELISKNYYNGSLASLILDNSDYLIDFISLKLSTTSNLTPTIPSVLLIIIKLSKIDLLLKHQLDDVITEMFIIIDSFHGFSLIVENFFIVFEELVKQIQSYTENKNLLKDVENKKKPYGFKRITDIDDLKLFIEQNTRDENYFASKNTVDKSNDLNDSDDEIDQVSEKDDDKNTQKWNSYLDQKIYFLLQKIFKYGFRILNHRSYTLKVQILKTLIIAVPLLCSDYDLILPIILENWPIILSLIAGVESLSKYQNTNKNNFLNFSGIIDLALELSITIMNEDNKSGLNFLSTKFIESWNFLLNNSKIFMSLKNTHVPLNTKERKLTTLSSSQTTLSKKTQYLYIEFIITGLNYYESFILEKDKLEMVLLSYKTNLIEEFKLVDEIKNYLWLVKTLY